MHNLSILADEFFQDPLSNLTTNISIALSVRNQQNVIFVGYLYISVTILSYLANTFFLLIYCTSPHLRTPFLSYIVTLSVLDLVKSCTSNIASISNSLQRSWIFGEGFCQVVLYCAQSTSASIVWMHVLISANRLWAVTYPFADRLRHSHKLTATLIVVLLLAVNALSMAVFIGKENRNRSADSASMCIYNFRSQSLLYSRIYGYFTHQIPQLLVILIYPAVIYKLKTRRKVRICTGRVRPAVHTISSSMEAPTSANSFGFRGQSTGRSVAGRGGHFRILTILFVSSILFWTPGHVIYSLLMTTPYLDVCVLAVVNFLFTLDCTINPFLCLVTSKNFKKTPIVLKVSMLCG